MGAEPPQAFADDLEEASTLGVEVTVHVRREAPPRPVVTPEQRAQRRAEALARDAEEWARLTPRERAEIERRRAERAP